LRNTDYTLHVFERFATEEESSMELNDIDRGIRVLVVDDNEALSEVIALMLSGCGYRCESAKNGVEAMQRIWRSRFDAVVTDLEMPVMDGIALTRELRQYFSSLPVMIMTGYSDDDHKETALRAGAKEFLSKPFEVSELTGKLHKMLLGHTPVKDQGALERPCF
jgi:CheY-like chemotaxis protein